jgi:hypothetical protein
MQFPKNKLLVYLFGKLLFPLLRLPPYTAIQNRKPVLNISSLTVFSVMAQNDILARVLNKSFLKTGRKNLSAFRRLFSITAHSLKRLKNALHKGKQYAVFKVQPKTNRKKRKGKGQFSSIIIY